MMGMTAFFVGGAVFVVLSGLWKRGRTLRTVLGAACTAGGVLAGLAAGRTLDALLGPVLALCALSMAALLYRKGDSR